MAVYSDLVLRMFADTRGLSKSMDKVRTEVETSGSTFDRWGARVKNAFGGLKSGVSSILKGDVKGGINSLGGAVEGLGIKGMGAVAGVAAVAAAVATLYQWGKKALDVYKGLAGELSGITRATGLEGGGALDLYAQFKMTGTDVTAAGTALGRFAKALQDARNGGASLNVFDSLGVSVRDANGQLRDGNDVLRDTREALSQIEDRYQRNATALQLFGRGWQSLGKWIGASKDDIAAFNKIVRESGFTWGKDQVKDYKEFVKLQREMNLRWQLMWAMLGQKILPVVKEILQHGITPMVRKISNAAEAAQKLYKAFAAIPGLADATSAALDKMMGPLKPLFDSIDKLSTIINFLGDLKPGQKMTQGQFQQGFSNPLNDLFKSLLNGAPGGSQLYGWLSGLVPGFASGGVATGPQSGYLAMLHGTETVTPGRGAGGDVHIHIGAVNGTDRRAARELAQMVGAELARGARYAHA